MKLKGNIVQKEIAFYGEIEFETYIKSVKKISEVDQQANWIYPGFVDLHVHGGGGCDIMEGQEAIRKVLKAHAQYGTSSLLVTTVTEAEDKLLEVFEDISHVQKNPEQGEANILGVHLEGPFLSPNKLGAQPDQTISFDLELVKKLHSISPIRVITLAPESNPTQKDIKELKSLGIVLQLGHSNASYEEVTPFINKDSSITHLFNAMSGLHHRAPGIVGAAMAHAHYAEVIPDLIHVHPGAIKAALRAIPNIYFVTDGTAASGMPDGEYKLGPQKVYKCAHGVRLEDGTLAGSSLTMDLALKNALTLGLKPSEASMRLSFIQCQLIGQKDRGEIKEELRADLAVFDSQHKLLETYQKGEKL